MKLPAWLDSSLAPRDGDTPRDHIERYARYPGDKVLAAYVVELVDRVDALERRVAELEARQG
jgi:hypothetical protein